MVAMNDGVYREQEKALNDKLRVLKNLIPEERKRFFHLNTVSNFIYHLDQIKTPDDRNWIQSTLLSYLDEAMANINSMNMEVSKQLYKSSLEKLARYYDEYLGFTMIIYLWVIVFFYLVLTVIISFFLYPYIGILPVIAVFTYHMTYLYRKHKQKKLFGTFY